MLRACGITEFLSPVEKAATARIKQRPEDFVVVEVDHTGARTDAVDYRLPITAVPVTLTAETQPHNSRVSVAAVVNNDHDVAYMSVSATELLTTAMHEALLTFFGSKQDAIAKYASGLVEKDISLCTREYLVGVFNLKEERRRLHYALKANFPHLQTETRRVLSQQGLADVVDYHVIAKYDNDYLLLAHLLGERVADAVTAWSGATSRSNEFRITAELPPQTTKDRRRELHRIMAKRHPDIVCRVANGWVTLSVLLKKQREKRSRDGAGSASSGKFFHLLVRKRNLDMMELRILLAEHFGVSDTAVCTAGLKDKCAVTYQRCSVPDCTQANKQQGEGGNICRLTWPGHSSSYAEILQVYGPCPVPVDVGQLNGNWFNIRLVDVRGITRNELIERLRRVESDGFLNYFGQQRFGEHVRNTLDHVGVHLIAGRWAEAVKSIMDPIPGLYTSFPDRMEVRYVPVNVRDAQCVVQALRRLHRVSYASLSPPLSTDNVLQCTSRWQQLCHDALLDVPYPIRVLWIIAAQSLIFNLMLSKLCRAGPLLLLDTVSALPLLGYQMTMDDTIISLLEQTLVELGLEVSQMTQKKVLGVPFPGALRSTVVRPVGCSLTFEDSDQKDGEDGFSASLSFFLPPSSYATIFLREVMGCDQWW